MSVINIFKNGRPIKGESSLFSVFEEQASNISITSSKSYSSDSHNYIQWSILWYHAVIDINFQEISQRKLQMCREKKLTNELSNRYFGNRTP